MLHYEHRGLLTPRLHRAVWVAVRALARRLRGGARTYVLSLGAPLMMVSALAAWMVLLVVGFALVYLPGLETGALAPAPAGTPPAVSAVYFSAVTLSTLGLGDLTPRSPIYQLVTAVEALAGLGLATMRLRAELEASLHEDPEVQRLLDEVVARRLDPASAAAEVLARRTRS